MAARARWPDVSAVDDGGGMVVVPLCGGPEEDKGWGCPRPRRVRTDTNPFASTLWAAVCVCFSINWRARTECVDALELP